MRIAYFVDEFPPFFRGGLGTYAARSLACLSGKGTRSRFFHRNTGSDPTSENLSGIDVHRPNLMKFSDILSIINPDEIKTWDENGQEFFAETLQVQPAILVKTGQPVW